MARRKASERNVRSLFKLAGGKSFAMTLPIEVLRDWGWDKPRQQIVLTIDDKKQRIVIAAVDQK
jgi:hypothetical protein